MSERLKQIGLDRLVRIAWLEKTSTLILAANDTKTIKSILQDELAGAFRSANKDVRGSLDKTITILLKVWHQPPKDLKSLRNNGLELLKRISSPESKVIHWGMVSAVYPFWSSVAAQIGRLLKLQGTVTSIQIQRRIREQYGERETVSRRARYIIRSFLDWGVLRETERKGIYKAQKALLINDIRLIAWLIEASLYASKNGSIPLKELVDSPALFPFQITSVRAESLVATSQKLEFLRHGLDEELMMLKNFRCEKM